MPIAALIPLAIAAASGYASWRQNRNNKKSQEKQNAADREFQERMYEKQREDNLEDFANQNAFNSPVQQMERLRQAGLNPNLVYGKGAETTAANIKGGNVPSGNQPAPQLDNSFIGNAGEQYYKIRNIQAQTDNLGEQNVLLKKEALLKDSNIAKNAIETARGKFDLDQANRLKDIVVEKATLDNQKTTADIVYTLDKNEREEIANSKNVDLTIQKIAESKLDQYLKSQQGSLNSIEYAKKVQEVENLKIALENAKKDGKLKQIDIDLRDQGINPQDPSYMRILMRMLQHYMGTESEEENYDSSPWPVK